MVLSTLRVEDAGEMSGVLADPALYRYTGGAPPTEDELRRRYTAQVAGRSPDGTQRWFNWVVRLAADGTAVGHTQATLDLATRSAELAWVVGLPWQGRGLASRGLALTMRELAGAETVTRWVAHVHPDHRASRAVARRAGLRPTGRLVDGEEVWEAVRDGG